MQKNENKILIVFATSINEYQTRQHQSIKIYIVFCDVKIMFW